MLSPLTAVPTVAVRWLLGVNLEQSRIGNFAAYVAIMLAATALGANPIVAWLAVLTVRTVGRLTLFRLAAPADGRRRRSSPRVAQS